MNKLAMTVRDLVAAERLIFMFPHVCGANDQATRSCDLVTNVAGVIEEAHDIFVMISSIVRPPERPDPR
jgi:hypothetical protein